MRNKERQQQLDKIKWFESERQEKDTSGSMSYCQYCTLSLNGTCLVDQQYRENKSPCATAYNRMERKRKL